MGLLVDGNSNETSWLAELDSVTTTLSFVLLPETVTPVPTLNILARAGSFIFSVGEPLTQVFYLPTASVVELVGVAVSVYVPPFEVLYFIQLLFVLQSSLLPVQM